MSGGLTGEPPPQLRGPMKHCPVHPVCLLWQSPLPSVRNLLAAELEVRELGTVSHWQLAAQPRSEPAGTRQPPATTSIALHQPGAARALRATERTWPRTCPTQTSACAQLRETTRVTRFPQTLHDTSQTCAYTSEKMGVKTLFLTTLFLKK